MLTCSIKTAAKDMEQLTQKDCKPGNNCKCSFEVNGCCLKNITSCLTVIAPALKARMSVTEVMVIDRPAFFMARPIFSSMARLDNALSLWMLVRH